jgi:hypothetical protein
VIDFAAHQQRTDFPESNNLSDDPTLPGIAVTKRLWEIRAEHRRSTLT